MQLGILPEVVQSVMQTGGLGGRRNYFHSGCYPVSFTESKKGHSGCYPVSFTESLNIKNDIFGIKNKTTLFFLTW